MAYGNKTQSVVCRFLSDSDFAPLHRTFIDAFSDYAVPFRMSEEQFQNHIALNGVVLDKSVGVFHGDRMIGFTLNGFGEWNGLPTVYDAGTAVLPDSRRLGAARAAFEYMMPILRDDGWRQILLEVISTNDPAVELYRSLGFNETRRLVFFDLDRRFEASGATDYPIRVIANPDWEELSALGNGRTSWQNSVPSMQRSARRIILGAYDGDRLVGFAIVFQFSGIISQLAINPAYRGRGIAKALVAASDKLLEGDKTLKFSNVDDTLEDAVAFLRHFGFTEKFAQLEMIKTL